MCTINRCRTNSRSISVILEYHKNNAKKHTNEMNEKQQTQKRNLSLVALSIPRKCSIGWSLVNTAEEDVEGDDDDVDVV